MSSISAFLIKRPNSRNLYPIAIRIIKDRKASYIYLGQAIKKNQWDLKNKCVKNTHPDALEINQLILYKLSKANKSLISASVKEKYTSSKSIKNDLISKESNDFFAVAKIYLTNIRKRKQFHQCDIESRRIQIFKDFVQKEKLYFNEINIGILNGFAIFLSKKKGFKGANCCKLYDYD